MNFFRKGQSKRRAGHLSVASLCAVLLASGVVACGNSATTPTGDSSPSASGSGLGKAAELVPDSMKNQKIKVAVLNDYAPYGFMEGKDLVGVAPDLTRAIAADTGLDIELEVSAFASIIPGLQAKRWDFAVPTFSITDERRQVLDFVSVQKSATGFITLKDSGIKIAAGGDLCGHSVGAPQGTVNVDAVNEISAQCEKDGKSPVELQTFSTADQPVLALASSRVDAIATATVEFGPIVKQGAGKFEAQPYQHAPVLEGAGFPKGSPLAPIVEQAVKDLIANGKYKEILAKYDQTAAEISNPEILK